VHYPVRGGRDIAIVGIFAASASAADWSAPADTAAVNAHVSGFPGPVRQLFAAVPEWRMWALHDLPRLPWPAQGPTALLGDAAHPMMPFLAQGGAMALEDAVVLADCLAQRPTIADAWQSYARLRHPRTSRVEAGARRNGRIYHLSGLAAAARNLTLGTIPGTRIMAGYDWLYGWRPPTA
jgi:salicylate hydroxylase